MCTAGVYMYIYTPYVTKTADAHSYTHSILQDMEAEHTHSYARTHAHTHTHTHTHTPDNMEGTLKQMGLFNITTVKQELQNLLPMVYIILI